MTGLGEHRIWRKKGVQDDQVNENTLKQAESTVGERQVTTATQRSPRMHAQPQDT